MKGAMPSETWISNLFMRVLPEKTATFTDVTRCNSPRSSVSEAPSPLPDQRVVRLPSTALAGTLPSLVLAVTLVIGSFTSVLGGVGVAVGGTTPVALTTIVYIPAVVLPLFPSDTVAPAGNALRNRLNVRGSLLTRLAPLSAQPLPAD